MATNVGTTSFLEKIYDAILHTDSVSVQGKISEVIGLLIESTGPAASIGEVCSILSTETDAVIGQAEVVGFRKDRTLLMPLGPLEGIHPGFSIVSTKKPLQIELSGNLLGRILNGLGKPIDAKGGLKPQIVRSIYSRVPNPLTRKRIATPFETGIRPIDSLITLGRGQRIGIFSGSGVGKSILLGMMARNCCADVNVIALIGERGREVREFIERDLGADGLARSVVVVATSDQPALIRLKGALVAVAIAEYFRDLGKDVLFLCDSLTRMALAQREIGLAIGEPPATKGFTPSVFAMLPQFLERAGTSDVGTITGLFTVLVEGDDLDEPISDAARGILDGHIVLSRKLAHRNHYPAIDILQSISRCQSDVVTKEHLALAARAKNLLAIYKENEDLIQIGAYATGSNLRIDKAIKAHDGLQKFLRQDKNEKASFAANIASLEAIVSQVGELDI
ncbi:MAG: FliI/YscN family ATPase [Chitinivibrionales bacterium]|nr:FliI/YscN family ATPase [Chitinivibrionales bacterium]